MLPRARDARATTARRTNRVEREPIERKHEGDEAGGLERVVVVDQLVDQPRLEREYEEPCCGLRPEEQRRRERTGTPDEEAERIVRLHVVHLADEEDRCAEEDRCHEDGRMADVPVRAANLEQVEPRAVEQRKPREQHGDAKRARDLAPVGGEEENHARAEGGGTEDPKGLRRTLAPVERRVCGVAALELVGLFGREEPLLAPIREPERCRPRGRDAHATAADDEDDRESQKADLDDVHRVASTRCKNDLVD